MKTMFHCSPFLLSSILLLGGCATAGDAPAEVVAPSSPARASAAPPPSTHTASPKLAGMQYLYGSAEADAITRQAWAAITDFVERRLTEDPKASVVLAKGSTLAAPQFEPCAGKPRAAVFDVDETVLLNLGFEYDDLTGTPERPFEPRWEEWERDGFDKVVATPGAVEALTRLRALDVKVIFNTNRKDAQGAIKALDAAGLGPAVHRETLFVQGDEGAGEPKDPRRSRIAQDYCVIALGGDQLGDFSDLFNDGGLPAQRRERAGSPEIAKLWGQGWFVFPNPVYGKALKGKPDEIFPAQWRWHPKGDN